MPPRPSPRELAHSSGSAPPTPRPPTTRPSTARGTPPGAARKAAGASEPSASAASPNHDLRDPLGTPEPGCGRRRGERDIRTRGDGVVHPVLLDRVATAVDDGNGDSKALARRRRDDEIAQADRPRELVLACRGWRRLHPETVLGADDEVTEASLPPGAIVTVLPDVRDPQGIGDEEVLGVGRLAVRAHHLGSDTRREERADRRAGGGDPADDDAVTEDRHATGPGEHRLWRGADEPRADRCRQSRHPLQVLGAGDLLGGRDPRLRPGTGHAARSPVVEA